MLLIRCKITHKTAIDTREQKSNNKFSDYCDVVNSVKGLSDKTILTIIDEWSK